MQSPVFDLDEAKKLKSQGKTYKEIAALFSVKTPTLLSRMMKGAICETPTRQCAQCGASNVNLHRHHICYQQNRVVLLCGRCHAEVHVNDRVFKYRPKPDMVQLPEPIQNASRLAQMLYCYRLEKGLSIRSLASQIGINYLAILRLENGGQTSSSNMTKIITWMFGTV